MEKRQAVPAGKLSVVTEHFPKYAAATIASQIPEIDHAQHPLLCVINSNKFMIKEVTGITLYPPFTSSQSIENCKRLEEKAPEDMD
jgi:hypothetical protein